MKRPFLILLFAGPLVTLLLVLTTEWHGLYYQSVVLEAKEGMTRLVIEKGPGLPHSHHCQFGTSCRDFLAADGR